MSGHAASDLARELRDDYPGVDVTTVGFSRDFAGIACCVIPQERVLAVISALDSHAELVKALEEIARQKIGDEIEEDASDSADFEGAYESLVKCARAALATLTERKVG